MEEIKMADVYDSINAIVDKILFEDSNVFEEYEVYHYTNEEIVEKILRDSGICFRMTHFEDFEDKLEGKVVDVYLDMALERLLKSNKIDYDTYLKLVPENKPIKTLFTFDVPGQPTRAKNLEFDAYITCFCKKQNDEYMYKNYANINGYCIGFSSMNLKDNTNPFGKGFELNLQQIMYGEEIIDYFTEKILLLLSNTKGLSDDEHILQSVLYLLRQKVQYSSKLFKYKNENELRLILKIPKETEFNFGSSLVFGINEERNKRFVEVEFPKYCYCGIDGKTCNPELLERLKHKNYK